MVRLSIMNINKLCVIRMTFLILRVKFGAGLHVSWMVPVRSVHSNEATPQEVTRQESTP
jgi:hypothetical protein